MQGRVRERAKTLKVLWDEHGEIHSARALSYITDGPFLAFDLIDGRVLRLSSTCILKIEEVPP